MCKYIKFIYSLTIICLLNTPSAMAVNSYDPNSGLIAIDSIIVDLADFKNIVVQPDQLVSYSVSPTTSTVNTFDRVTGHVTLYSLTVGTTTYSNVVITVKTVISWAEPTIIPLTGSMRIRGDADLPHCLNGPSPQPCPAIVVENAEELRNVCNSLIGWRRKAGVFSQESSAELCPIETNFDWGQNRFAIIYSSLEDYYIDNLYSKISFNVNCYAILEYSDKFVIYYGILYPSQLMYNVEFEDYLGNIQAIPIPNNGKPVLFSKLPDSGALLRK